MIDPNVWAATPGLGRAPLLPDPAVQNPMQDIARRLMAAQGVPEDTRVMAGDRPIGAIVRDPATMTRAQQEAEYNALGGLNPSLGEEAAIRAPAALAGLAALGAGGIGSYMANRGVEDRVRQLASALGQGRAAEVQAQAQRASAMEAGRQRAKETLENFNRTRRSTIPRSGPGSPRARPRPERDTGSHQGTGGRSRGNQSRDISPDIPI